MSGLEAAFARARKEARLAFVPYVTGGDPDRATSLALIRMLSEEGADLIEVGVPFSDPLADGVTNQRAAERALALGMTLAGVLDLIEEVRPGCCCPVVLFTYFNPIFRMGIEQFARRAARAGVDAVLATDLPPEEAEEYRRALGAAGLEPIFMLSPTSGAERLSLVVGLRPGFVYYVSRPGVTGARDQLPAGLREQVMRIRLATDLPVVVGFGISKREHFQALAGAADGVVVGSALVRLIEAAEESGTVVEAVRGFVRDLLQRDPGAIGGGK